ncbi:peroxisome membrane protein, partial [Dipodascopsis tothii]|uniref:peroxisome membrane protein n=1 Tax=Dipodascopsis tothii TaxID=44089 RepID=UPI0034CD8EB2
WLRAYESVLIKNADQISSIESTLQSLTFVLPGASMHVRADPGRFKETELTTEALYSVLHILGIYHDSIIARAVERKDPTARPSAHTRYTRFWARTSKTYSAASTALTVLRYTEILCEMVARRRDRSAGVRSAGASARWRLVLLLELVKASLRLTLLRTTGYRMLLHSPLAQRDVDPAALEAESAKAPAWRMPRTGRALPQIDSETFRTSEAYLLSRTLVPDDASPADRLVRPLSVAGVTYEVAYILRPLVYAVLMFARASVRPTSAMTAAEVARLGVVQRALRHPTVLNWLPWAAGLAIETVANRGLARSLAPGARFPLQGLTAVERAELGDRAADVRWWALRGPFYDAITKYVASGRADRRPVLDRIVAATETVPLVSLASSIVADYEYLLEHYHFACTS